ncbi:GNAT family N-acetyltransferase [Glycomyces niveus]|uniref:GNAT family N-acetyltransferase n=1 Tax=Glycomyces niveus TaxID=2820287 RepID=A0ABS3U0P1_9ACTN|nr:GNAT family N-acetyltransferase [Glycomyces sp. NEAU-S30]MBO3732336.1 GNAT family N-acetyltransferase [Glycomyces sp. NEAU-S30]
MRFRVLGPLQAESEGRLLRLGGPRQRAVLAALLASPNRTVSRSRLIELAWDEPTPSAEPNLRSYISKLRSLLGGTADGGPRIRYDQGFLIRVEPGELDLWDFERHVELARRADRIADAAASLERALALVRGEPFQDVVAGVRFDGLRAALQERLDQAAERHIDLKMDLGAHAALIGELRTLLAQQPLREHLAAQLMLALARSGRRGEALAVYRGTRERLVEALGTEPDRELQEVHHRVLNGRIGSDEPRPAAAPPAAPVDLLPFGLRVFTGRDRELKLLDTIADPAAPARIAVVSGSAGMGKTAVAVHWAHRAADDFPDGRLYADLRGFGPAEAPADPGEVLRTFLEALGDAPASIPVGTEARAARFRRLLADKRILIVLDNARDPVQVRPLLPGAPDCAVVVTSRNRLTGLIASTAALVVPLEAMDGPQARTLLAGRLGTERLASDPIAVQRIADACKGLPLALSLVAANAASRPGDPLAALADELGSAGTLLDGLGAADPATDPRTLLRWSYRQLSPAAARLLRLLAVHPGPDCSARAAASAARTSLPSTRAALAELVEASLLLHAPDHRYGLHDLVRAFAIELAAQAPDEREATARGLLDHYLHTAFACDRLLDPSREPINLAPTEIAPHSIIDGTAAMRWFAAETPVLLAAVEHAAALGFDVHVWQLAWTLLNYLNRQGRWPEIAVLSERALAAATRLGDTAAQARALRDLGQTCARLGRFPEAHVYLDRALALCENDGDRRGQAHAHHLRGRLLRRQGRLPEALEATRRALALFQSSGDRMGQARTLQAIGYHHLVTGDYAAALPDCEQAVELFRALGDPVSENAVRDDIATVHHHLGDHARAVAEYEHALARFRELGFRPGEAEVLIHLGETHHAAGAPREARRAWEAALAICEDLAHPATESLRARLDGRAQLPRSPSETWLPYHPTYGSIPAMTPVLQTERLLLEPYATADEADFVALFQDTRVSQWMGNGPQSKEEDRALFGRIFTKVYAEHKFDVWAVRENGVFVGHAEIKPTEESGGHELIYALAHHAWGRGLGTELAQAIIDYGFDVLGLDEVHATVADPNTASLAVMKRIGFEHVRDIAEDDGTTTRVLTLTRPCA